MIDDKWLQSIIDAEPRDGTFASKPDEEMTELAGTLSLPRSIAWHLERLTDAEAARFCEEAGLAPLTAGEFREQWTGSTWDDLAMLIYIRREDEPDGE